MFKKKKLKPYEFPPISKRLWELLHSPSPIKIRKDGSSYFTYRLSKKTGRYEIVNL